jgi:hypothetical protein
MEHDMKHDDFLKYLYSKSSLSQATQATYIRITTQCCRWTGKPHVLDNTPADLDAYRLHLLTDRHYSPASDTLIYAALRHTYAVLLPLVDAAAAKPYQRALATRPRQQYRLPQVVTQDDARRFVAALPETACGHILRDIYLTSRPFSVCANGWKCSNRYAQAVCARTARSVGLPHGFGVSGLRSASILHRLQTRTDDTEIKTILDDCGLSHSQYHRYLQAAGILSSRT